MKVALTLLAFGIGAYANSIFGWWTVTPASVEALVCAIAAIIVIKIEKRI